MLLLCFSHALPAQTAAPQIAVATNVAPAPSSPLPLLVVEEEAPLLLDATATASAHAFDAQLQPGMANNAACYVCHVNFKEDPFVQWHARTNIGCVRCHGESRAHVADEANLTPPDNMFWPSKSGLSCMGCHTNHTAPAREVLARWLERCPHKTNPRLVLCIDCHGNHRLPVRTIVWDKKTGALLAKTTPTLRQKTGPTSASPAAPVAPASPGHLSPALTPPATLRQSRAPDTPLPSPSLSVPNPDL